MRAFRTACMTGTVIAALSAAGPAAASIDATALTCGDFRAANGPGKDAMGRAVLLWTRDTRNAASAGTLPSQFLRFTKTEVRQRIAQRCSGQPADANIIARLLTPV
jgi:hypothetical protein